MAKKKSVDLGIDYYRDNALENENEDEFEHKHYVSVLKDILLKSQTPINVGLYGKWGVGKSSIVHMLKNEIKNDKKLSDFEYVEVDAWGISGKSLQQGILEEINAKLNFPYRQEELEDKLYNVHQVETLEFGKLFKSYWWIWAGLIGAFTPLLIHTKDDIISSLSILGFASIIGALVPLSRLFFSTSKRIIPRAVSTFQFNTIYEDIISQRKKKLVVVIDNLDRCEDTVAVELLGIIQTFMVKKNCINILACDDEAIVTHLKNVKKNYTDKDGNEFLSKFFQVTIRIPPFIGVNLSSYAEKLMKKRSVKFSSYVKPILISGAIENPRKINQFLNIAVALYRLAEFKEKAGKLQKDSITGNTNFLMKIIVIRHEWPEFYKALESNPKLLNDKDGLDTWGKEQVTHEKINKEEFIRLKEFLHKTRTSHIKTKDIMPFLKLNQESYAAETNIDKFEDAFISLDSAAVEIFQELNDEKQEQYLNKINDIMKSYEDEPEKLTLVNCALSLIDILPNISDADLRVNALGILGQYMSSELLESLDKFDIEQLGLFGILEDMEEHFSEPIYNQFIDEAFDKELNEDLIEKFFKNGNIVRAEILDQIDEQFTNEMVEKDYNNTEFIKKCINNYDWSENNISKPSKMASHIISKISFDENPDNPIFTELYDSLKNSLTDEENEKYYENIQKIIDNCDRQNTALNPSLLEHLKNSPIETFDFDSNVKQNLFASLCNLIESNPDLAQNQEVLHILSPLYQKINELSNQTISPEKYLEDAFAHYVKRSDAEMIRDLLSLSLYNEFLENERIIISLLDRYTELGSNIPEIIRTLLKQTSYSTSSIILSKFEEMIASQEVAQFQTLLATAKENDPEFNSDIIQKIGEVCLKEAQDNENPNSYAMYEHAIELKLDSYGRTQVSDYAIKLVNDQDTGKQDQGFSLLRKFNSTYSDQIDPVGINAAIKMTDNFIKNNSERAIHYLGFIYEYKDRFGYSEKRNLTNLLRDSLQSNASENIMNNVIEYTKRSPQEIIVDVFDELIGFARGTTYPNVKEQCKQIFIENKDKLSSRHKNSIKEIYDENVLD